MIKVKNILLVIVSIVYLLFPRDIIPDFLFPWGLGDDLIFLLYVLYKLTYIPVAYRQDARDIPAPAAKANTFDPYQALGVSKDAAPDDIQEAYKRQLTLYHPDKVNHLGEDLRSLAAEKTLEINKAYDILTSNLRK